VNASYATCRVSGLVRSNRESCSLAPHARSWSCSWSRRAFFESFPLFFFTNDSENLLHNICLGYETRVLPVIFFDYCNPTRNIIHHVAGQYAQWHLLPRAWFILLNSPIYIRRDISAPTPDLTLSPIDSFNSISSCLKTPLPGHLDA
jgi:hypothetical protein